MAERPKKLTDSQIDAQLPAVPEWAEVGETIQRTFQFADFAAAMRFVGCFPTWSSHHW
jgi:pterin-4a-carbinolamine dehydratase